MVKKTYIAALIVFAFVSASTFSLRAQDCSSSQQSSLNQNTGMKIGIIIETKEYEKAWNAFRFAIVAKEQGNEVRVFLMGFG